MKLQFYIRPRASDTCSPAWSLMIQYQVQTIQPVALQRPYSDQRYLVPVRRLSLLRFQEKKNRRMQKGSSRRTKNTRSEHSSMGAGVCCCHRCCCATLGEMKYVVTFAPICHCVDSNSSSDRCSVLSRALAFGDASLLPLFFGSSFHMSL